MVLKSLLRPLYQRIIRSERVRRRAGQMHWTSVFLDWAARHPYQHRIEGKYHNRSQLHEYVANTLSLVGPIEYLEFGVYQGESLLWWLAKNKHPDSRFVGFDSFLGLPEEWSGHQPQGQFSTAGKPPVVDDARCSFQVGWFQDTLPVFLAGYRPNHRLVIHLDADLYSSTLYVLSNLAPYLKPDTVLLFDEFRDVQHEFRAFHDFTSAFPLNYEVVASLGNYGKIAVRVLPSETSRATP